MGASRYLEHRRRTRGQFEKDGRTSDTTDVVVEAYHARARLPLTGGLDDHRRLDEDPRARRPSAA
jgi:hypothetical protein